MMLRLQSWMFALAGLCLAVAAATSPGNLHAAAPQPLDRIVAIVNAEVITERELQSRVDAIQKRIARDGGRPAPLEQLREQVLERVILDAARLQAARASGISIDEATIDRTVARLASDAGRSVEQFVAGLRAEGVLPEMFRREIALELALGRVRDRDIDPKVQVSEAEVDAWLEDQKTAIPQINLAQILVSVPEAASSDQLASARALAEQIARGAQAGTDFNRILASYASTGQSVTGGVLGLRPLEMLPELFVQAVSKLAVGDATGPVQSPVGFHVLRVLERRGAGADSAAPVRQTRARHILVRIDAINPESEVIRRLTEVRERLLARTVSFADMARQYSADGSASQGGDLGWLYPGDTVPEFEAAMNALAVGEVSEPIRSPFGLHLIEVTERRTDSASADRVRAQARAAIRARKSAEAFEEWSALARDRAYVQWRLDDR
jgi:peptidyl-prolyl cis-trans isomerase SurA